MVHVAAFSLLVAIFAALLAGGILGAYLSLRLWRLHIASPKNARELVRRLHLRAHDQAMSCLCCDAMQVSEQEARRELQRRGIDVDGFVARAKARRDQQRFGP